MAENTEITFAEIKAILKQSAIRQAQTDEQLAELQKKNSEERAEINQMIKETQQEIKETQQEIKDMQQGLKDLKVYVEGVASELRGLGITQGDIAEEVFFQSLSKGKRLGNIHFDIIRRKVKDSKISPEFDILLVNSVSVGLIEVKANLKTQLRNKHKKERGFEMKALIDKKIKQFRESCPEYAGYTLYFGFGTLITDEELIEQARENGIFLLTQNGDHIEVVNDHVRAF